MKFIVIIFYTVLNTVISCYCDEILDLYHFSLVAFRFRYYRITPEYLRESPRELLQVKWADAEADLGNVLHASQVLEVPDIKWNCDLNSYYTLYMFDIDPLGQKNVLLTEGKQWVIGNIINCSLAEGDTIADYLPPTPVFGAGDHRYVFALYKQKRKTNFEESFIRKTQIVGRFYTDITKFGVKYDLGDPFAGNFFLNEYDSSSDDADIEQPLPDYILDAYERADLPQQE